MQVLVHADSRADKAWLLSLGMCAVCCFLLRYVRCLLLPAEACLGPHKGLGCPWAASQLWWAVHSCGLQAAGLQAPLVRLPLMAGRRGCGCPVACVACMPPPIVYIYVQTSAWLNVRAQVRAAVPVCARHPAFIQASRIPLRPSSPSSCVCVRACRQ